MNGGHPLRTVGTHARQDHTHSQAAKGRPYRFHHYVDRWNMHAAVWLRGKADKGQRIRRTLHGYMNAGWRNVDDTAAKRLVMNRLLDFYRAQGIEPLGKRFCEAGRHVLHD